MTEKECPCCDLLQSIKKEEAISDAYHILANECEKLMAKNGDMRGMRRIFYKCYAPTGLVGDFINWWSNGQNVSHVSFIFPKPNDEGEMELWEVEALAKEGVVGHAHDPAAREGQYRYIDVTIEDYRIMAAVALGLVGTMYDKPGIWGFITRSRREDPLRWFCSEALSYICRKGNNPLTRKPDYTVMPNDCWASVAGTPCSKDEVHV